jgi:hypothetical protein
LSFQKKLKIKSNKPLHAGIHMHKHVFESKVPPFKHGKRVHGTFVVVLVVVGIVVAIDKQRPQRFGPKIQEDNVKINKYIIECTSRKLWNLVFWLIKYYKIRLLIVIHYNYY